MGHLVIETVRPVDDLSRALTREMGMAAEDASEIAGYVMAAFNGQDELDDMELTPDLRSIFYTLEGHRLVTFRRHEFTNEDGEIRRHFYWHLRWENVVQDDAPAREARDDEASVYEALPRDAWDRAMS